MAEKVKVSREVANFIESCKDNGAVYWEDQLLCEHVLAIDNDFKDAKEESKCLDKYSPIELAQILINGYEIEETPEEKLLAYYEKEDRYGKLNHLIRKGIKDCLDILEIEVKGINV